VAHVEDVLEGVVTGVGVGRPALPLLDGVDGRSDESVEDELGKFLGFFTHFLDLIEI
jgi:hypothetical protein